MNWYDKEENVNQYIQMADGYDGSELIARLCDIVPEGSSVLG